MAPADGLFIQDVMRKSYVGLCISTAESICFSSMEFFLNGIPVITTKDDTGRLEWYTNRNSMFIDSVDPQTLRNAVDVMKSKVLNGEFNSQIIRQDTIELIDFYRARFNHMISDIFKEMNHPDISLQLFNKHYVHRFLYQTNWKKKEQTLAVFIGDSQHT